MADQIALRVAESQITAGSAVAVTANFRTRATGVASTPSSIRYRADCLTNHANVTNWTSVSAASSVTIDIAGTLNAIIDQDNEYETRQLTVEIDTGLSTQSRQAITWRVRNIRTYVPTTTFPDGLLLEPYYPITPAEIAAGVTPTAFQYQPGELLRIGEGVAGYTRSWTQRRIYNPNEFPGADFGAKLQACYNHALAEAQAGDGLGEGIYIFVPPNPDGSHWLQATAVDLSGGGYVHLFSAGGVYIRASAAISYHIRFGVTGKSDRMTIEGFEFDPGGQTIPAAIEIGGGTRCRVSDIGFHLSTGSYTNGINIDAANDPTGSGISHSVFENIADTGGSAITNATIKANGLIGSVIRNVRASKDATYGVQLLTGSQNVASNLIEMIVAESGVATNTALVRMEATTNSFVDNTIRDIKGQSLASYGIQITGNADKFLSNNFDVVGDRFATAAFDDSGLSSGTVLSPSLQVINSSGTFTPVWGADSSSPSIGDGTLTGRWDRYRKTLRVRIALTAGSTTTFGTGDWFFTLPAALQWLVATGGATGSARLRDANVGRQNACCSVAGGIATKIYVIPDGDGSGGQVRAAVPFTWVATDTLNLDIEIPLA